MLLITIINIVKAMIKGYKIWPKKIILCVDKYIEIVTFEVMVRKANVKKVVNLLSKVKEIIMVMNDCSEDCCYKYEVCECNACFNNSNIRHVITLRIEAEVKIVSMIPVLSIMRSRHKFHQEVYRIHIFSLVKNTVKLHISNVKTVLVCQNVCYKCYKLGHI
jgi:hypothetical protein